MLAPPIPPPPTSPAEPPLSEPPLPQTSGLEPPLPQPPFDPDRPAPADGGVSLLRGTVRVRVSSFLVSVIVHAAALLVLALLLRLADQPRYRGELIVVNDRPDSALDDLSSDTPAIQISAGAVSAPSQEAVEIFSSDVPQISVPTPGKPLTWDEVRPEKKVPDVGVAELLAEMGGPTGGGYEGRNPESRAALARQRGGSQGSEDAVELGLAWLAAHQRRDGSWRFNHHDGPCEGRCLNPGTNGSSTGATGLALLPFLGAGYLPGKEKYGDVVQRGLYFLTGRMLPTPHGGDLQEGTMYAQGIATLALCEAYAMTQDASLRQPAQSAIDFICHAQHPKGGWRYYPGQPGDTTVFGWQLMALKSGQMAGLTVPSPVIELAREYLNSVQTSDGANYGYQKPAKMPTPSAVGLLCRMYYGWRQDDSRLSRGVEYLSKLGPSKTDMYFNYYATQVLHHHGGAPWGTWNERQRDFLIAKQSRAGHENGSWYFVDEHGAAGGRLYTTAMCVMILEVYYRHLPLYGERTVTDGF